MMHKSSKKQASIKRAEDGWYVIIGIVYIKTPFDVSTPRNDVASYVRRNYLISDVTEI